MEYPQGILVIRFALSNKGDRIVCLAGIRLVFHTGSRLFGGRLVLDPIEDNRVLPFELTEGVANILGQGSPPVELTPGGSVDCRFELIRLANTLRGEGHTGNVRMVLEASDRAGNVYRHPFGFNTDLWAYPEER